MEQGWIKLHRKILDNPISKKPSYVWLWIYLLLNANHQDKKVFWNGEIITIKSGQILTGRKQLKEATGIAEGTIEGILTAMEQNQHQIQQQKTNKFRIITILKWSEYQGSDIKSDNKPTTKQQQTDTNKNVKNDKNEKKESNASVAGIPEVMRILEEKNPAIKRMYGNPVQRDATARLITRYGLEKVIGCAKFAMKVLGVPYAPRVTTPYLLETKWADLEAFYHESLGKKEEKSFKVVL